ncbi:MAG: cation diffusion facilitator family transporter [Dehalococcoidia bacterium]
MDHGHELIPAADGGSRITRRLRLAVIISGCILVGEAFGGYYANSLALLSDAGHVFTDFLALLLAWFAARQAERPATAQMTYGYHRLGIITAVANSLSLIAISGAIFYEAFQRWNNPEPVNSLLMISVAVVGLVANLVVVSWLRTDARENLNVRGAFWHAWGDALSSIGVVLAGVAMYFTGSFWLDPAVSVVVAVIILVGAGRLFRDGFNVLMEAPPRGMVMEEVAQAISQVKGVKGVHDLHVWSIASGFNALSCHICMDDLRMSEGTRIMAGIKETLERRFRIGHSNLQMECPGCGSEDLFCTGGFCPVPAANDQHSH